MKQRDVTTALMDGFGDLPKRLQIAARWVLDHPADVALLTTREQAKRTGLSPATFTRLAQRLGLAGYDELRASHAALLRQRPSSFSGRASELVERHAEEGDEALAQDIVIALESHLAAMREPASLVSLSRAAERLRSAAHVYCFGLRSAFPAAFMLDYLQNMIGSRSTLAEGSGGRGIDALRHIGKDDVLFAVSVAPYTRLTIQAAEHARSRGAQIVALTDSPHSPLSEIADDTVLVRTETPSFFHTMTPAFAAVECLAALMTARKGDAALSALAGSEAQLDAFDTYITPRRATRRKPEREKS